MDDIKRLLPIGSVVLLKEGSRKLMIFGVKQTDTGSGVTYDYIGVIYPEGNIGSDGQFFFNHENIQEVFFTGCQDAEREDFIQRLSDHFKKQTENT